MPEELAGDSARRATARETGGSAFPDLSRYATDLHLHRTPLSVCVE